tara:strand:+ start:666 stop:1223 length:558 start_codon:yes stop_codon:yes gene_type:complete
MNKIYKIIADLREKFVTMTYGLTTDKNEIDEVVQELMLYFLQMNPETLKNIYKKDGKKGIISYGAVVIRRSLQSKHSPYYYKYKKYYTRLDDSCNISRETIDGEIIPAKYIYNLPQEEQDKKHIKLQNIDKEINTMYWYDRELFKLYYYEDNTLDSLAKKTGIGRNSLFNTIDNVRNILKAKLNE